MTPRRTTLGTSGPALWLAARLIAFLALLGVDLVVIVVFVDFALWRKRCFYRQPGAFRGAIRLADGAFEGIAPKWRRGNGRWVRNVLVCARRGEAAWCEAAW